MILLTPLVREYLRNDSGRYNEYSIPCAKDNCNRILSPFDEAVIVHYTDEGYEILVKGQVRKVDDFQELIYCEVDSRFKDFGFEDGWFDANKAIRWPHTGGFRLENELLLFFRSLNITALTGRKPHKNGNPLRLG